MRDRAREWKRAAPYAVLAISGLLLIGTFALSQGLIGEEGTTRAPLFSQEDVEGQPVSLELFHGKPVVLDFFATWCVPCGPVTDNLVEVSQEYGDRVVILSISVDPIETEQEVRAYKTSHNASWQFLIDESDLHRAYDVSGIPKLVIVDQNGEIVFAKDSIQSSLSRKVISSALQKTLEGESGTIKIFNRSSVITLALLAGIISFFSPCAFPLLPGYLTYTAGHSQELLSERKLRDKLKKASLVGGSGALGLLLFLLSFGLILVLLGASLLPLVPLLEPLIGFALIISGILMLSNYTLDMNWFFRRLDKLRGNTDGFSTREGPFGVFLYGIGYGAAAMGCTAPIFLALILSATAEGGVIMGLLALIIFAAAMSSLLIGAAAVAAFTQDALLNRLKAPSVWLKKGSGLVLALVGLYLILFFIWYT
ncbi:MAG: thioredoxin-like domain-containing protein [Candidatus Hodarchaeales archaeon]|jgi:cytochrome c-type biogenesis protein